MECDLITNRIAEIVPLERVRYIFITHAHADHSGGAWALQQFTGAAVVCSQRTAEIMEAGDETAMSLVEAKEARLYPEDYTYHRCSASLRMAAREVVSIGDLHFEFLPSPGHSIDSYSCFVPELGAFFSGDTVFSDGAIAALPTPDFSAYELRHTIARISQLDIAGLFPGHFRPVMHEGGTSVARAKSYFDRLALPPSISRTDSIT
jgi:glyoxylase-like metal-dependent hydrolase (beta-lactamase superfamily II)